MLFRSDRAAEWHVGQVILEGGKTVAGFAAFKNHLAYVPFSGSVLGLLADELEGYTMTKSSLHFPVDRPLPKALVRKLVAARLADVRQRSR